LQFNFGLVFPLTVTSEFSFFVSNIWIFMQSVCLCSHFCMGM